MSIHRTPIVLLTLTLALALVCTTNVILEGHATSNIGLSMPSETQVRDLWISFLRMNTRLYGSIAEHEKRFLIFRDNIAKAHQLNQMEQNDVYGVSPFMDLTEQEFANMYLWREPRSAEQIRDASRNDRGLFVGLPGGGAANMNPKAVPASFDWREKGAVTPVKSQGSCGSCWAFSATGNIEGIYFNKKGRLVPLAEQQMVDCDHTCNEEGECNSGCKGGWMMSALQYAKEKGMQPSNTYPYNAHEGTCRYNATAAVVKIDGAVMLPEDEEQIKAYLAQHGPLAVALNAANLQFYFGGISDPVMCSPKKLSHGVLLVGYGRGKSPLGKEKDFWIVKNSWGGSWGESGYFRMARGKGTCGINTYVVSAIVNN